MAGCFSSMQLVFLGLKMVELLSRAELLFGRLGWLLCKAA